MNRLRTTKRLTITMLGLTVGVLTPLGPAFAQEPTTDLARPGAAELAADATRVVDDAPPVPPETLDFDLLADEVTAVLERMPAEEWVLADVAASLGGDPVAAFEFVRDHIGFDPYPGALRSPQATLAARAGNGWDRAQLLQALLAEAPLESRFASGTLDDPTTITTRALAGTTEPLPRPEATEVMPFALEPLLNRARRDHAAVVAALGEDYETLGADSATDVSSAEHAWLQIRQDEGEWLDLDPTLPDAAPGDTLASAAETYDELPADIQQLLTFRIVADSITDAGPTSEIVLDTTIPASTAADADVWLLFGPENTSAGSTLAGALGENPSFVPVLYLQGDARSGSPFSVGADTGEGGGTVLDDALGGLGGLGGSDATEGDSVPVGLTELRLEITAAGPGMEPETVERILFDGPTETALPAALDDAHHLLISNGGLDLRRLAVARGAVTMMAADILNEPEGATEYRLIDQLLPWAVADRTLAAVSEHVIAPSLGAPGEVRGYVGRPRAWIVSHGLDVDDESFRGAIDLALDGISLVGAAGTDAGDLARERLWYGVLQTALETEAARKRVRRSETDATLSSVSIDTAGGLERLDTPASDTETGALATALADGAIALGAGYGTSGSFWRVNPITGATTSVQEPGVRPSSYGGSYPGGGGGYYRIDPDMSSRRLNAPRRGSSGGGLEYQVVQVVSFAAAITGSFAVGWFIGRVIANVLDWMYSD